MESLQWTSLLLVIFATSISVEAALIRIMFKTENVEVVENRGSAEVCLMLSSPTSTALNVNVTSIPSGSATGGDDFVVETLTAMFDANSDTACVEFTVVDDMIALEGDETFTVTFTTPPGTIPGSPSTATVTIIDDDVLLVRFTEDDYRTREGEPAEICVEGIGEIARPAMATVSTTTDGTTTANMDYQPLTHQVTFSVGPQTHVHCIQVMVLDDDVVEGEEYFEAVIVSASPMPGVIIDTPNVTEVIIEDDDLVIGFEETIYSVDEEDGTAVVYVALLDGSLAGSEVVVTVVTEDDQAVAPGDYTSVTQMLTFNPSNTRHSVSIPITDDHVVEQTESFDLQLRGLTSTGVDVTIRPSQAVIEIAYNDLDVDITLSRTAPLYTGGSLTLTCTVTLDHNVDTGVRVVIEWSGPRNISGERYSTIPASGSGSTYTGSLTIRPLADKDGGTYTCTVTVTGRSNTQRATATDTVEIIVMDSLFQFRLSGLLSTCREFGLTDRSQKLDDITDAVLEALTDSCTECGITNNIIDIPSFVCYPDSHMYVTYRARLEGTSEIDSGSLISLLEKWVSGRASISVTGILMTVDPECPVAISSLSEEECLLIKHTPTTIPTTTSTGDKTSIPLSSSSMGTTGSSHDNITAIIGGIIAIIFIFIVALAIIIVVAITGIITFKLRSHRTVRKVEEHDMTSMDSPSVKGVAITTTPNEAYGQMDSKEDEDIPQYEDYEQMQPGGVETTPQYEVVCRPTECSPITQHPLPAVPSPLSVDETDEQAAYEPIPGDK